jgi:hypothetical protein
VIVYLHHRRTVIADLAGKLQHAAAGIPLILVGLENFRSGGEWLTAVIELAIGSVVLVAFVADVRGALRHRENPDQSHSALGWFDLAASALLMFEAFHGEHHKPVYQRAPFVAGMVAIALGLFHGRFRHFVNRRSFLEMDELGVKCRTSPIGRFAVTWSDLAGLDLSAEKAVFRRNNGREHVLTLRGLSNREAVRAAIEKHGRGMGLLKI